MRLTKDKVDNVHQLQHRWT